MKKILLFTILCAGQLYGMEVQNISDLLPELHNEIIKMALATSDNLEEAIKAIKVASALRGVRYDNLKDFTALVSVLAERFPDLTKREIADRFGTPIAKEYVTVNFILLFAIGYSSPIEEITPLVNQGADVNFYVSDSVFGPCTLLTLAVRVARVDIVKLLLDSGANPSFKLPINGMTALDIVLDSLNQAQEPRYESLAEKLTAIKTLLEEAMKKQQK